VRRLTLIVGGVSKAVFIVVDSIRVVIYAAYLVGARSRRIGGSAPDAT